MIDPTIALELRQAVADACRRLVESRLVVGTAGNVSARDGSVVAISPSGVDYLSLRPEHVGLHNLSGAPLDAPLKPSSELPLHLAIYADSDAAAIVHTHAPASTAASTIFDEIPASHYYTAMFGGGVRVAPYATFGTDELADNARAAMEGRTGALLGNHGAIVTGATMSEAESKAGYLEYICEVQLRAMSTGLPVRTLPPDEIELVANLMSGYAQAVKPA